MPHRASHWIWSCRNLMRMEVHLESVLSPTPTPHPSPHPSFSDCSKKCRRNYMKKHEKSSKIDPKTVKNERKTAPKQNQIKPRGPHGNLVEQKVAFWRLSGSLGVALGTLLHHLGSPWSIFCSSWGRFGSHLSMLVAFGWAWKLNQCIFGAFLEPFCIKKHWKKQCQNKFGSEFEKP